MPLKKKNEVTTQSYGGGKDQGRIRSGKEMEHGIDISIINIYIYTFYGRFEGEKMNILFAHLFLIRTTIEAQMRLGDSKKYILILIDHGLEMNIISRRIYEMDK